MKTLKNYRYYVIALLFAIGTISTLVVFGEPVPEMTARRWILIVVTALIVSASSFGVMAILIRVWKDEMSELTRFIRKEE